MPKHSKSQERAQCKLLNTIYQEKKHTIYYLCLGLTGNSSLAGELLLQAIEEIRDSLKPEELPAQEVLSRRVLEKALDLSLVAGSRAEAEEVDLPFWSALEENQRKLFALRYLIELPNKELAAALGQPVRKITGACTNLDTSLGGLLEKSFGLDCSSRATTPIHIRQRIVLEQNGQAFPSEVDKAVKAALSPAKTAASRKRKKWAIFAGGVVACAVILSAVIISLPGDTTTEVTGTYYAVIDVADYGTITVALDSEAAPTTVENFVSLAEAGFYDGLTFHRIIDGFMIQGGDPNGDGSGGSEETITGEFSDNGYENDLSHTRGAISMARSDDYDSASSQFFIVQEDSTYLDGSYACFGYVTDGMDIVDQICEDATPTDDNGTIEADAQPVISSITIYTAEEYAALS